MRADDDDDEPWFPGMDSDGSEKPREYLDDYGEKINFELISRPGLCILCKIDDDPNERIICDLHRHDQSIERKPLFECGDYQPRGPELPTPL